MQPSVKRFSLIWRVFAQIYQGIAHLILYSHGHLKLSTTWAWKIHGRTLNFFSTSVCNSASEGLEKFRLDIGDDVRVLKPKCAEVPTLPHLQVVSVIEAW